MPQTSPTILTINNPLNVALRAYKLRNRRLLKLNSGKKLDADYYEHEETDIA